MGDGAKWLLAESGCETLLLHVERVGVLPAWSVGLLGLFGAGNTDDRGRVVLGAFWAPLRLDAGKTL